VGGWLPSLQLPFFLDRKIKIQTRPSNEKIPEHVILSFYGALFSGGLAPLPPGELREKVGRGDGRRRERGKGGVLSYVVLVSSLAVFILGGLSYLVI
jgi:hypothetical protein